MTGAPDAIVPGLYGLVGGAVNVYVLDGGDAGLIVFDAGLPRGQNAILDLVRRLGRVPQDVKHILITHGDIDHIGGLKGLHAATGAPITASAASREYIEQPRNPPHVPLPMTVLAGLLAHTVRGTAPVAKEVRDGDVLDLAGGLRVIATPGHTADHISYFWERERVLIAGDALNTLGEGLRSTQPRITWNMQAAYQSIERLLALEPAVICCGHGQVWRASKDTGRLAALRAQIRGDQEK
jgi:glyoxylase-like metal-dependent hydrolase (beta-lactamase superfamily II)